MWSCQGHTWPSHQATHTTYLSGSLFNMLHFAAGNSHLNDLSGIACQLLWLEALAALNCSNHLVVSTAVVLDLDYSSSGCSTEVHSSWSYAAWSLRATVHLTLHIRALIWLVRVLSLTRHSHLWAAWARTRILSPAKLDSMEASLLFYQRVSWPLYRLEDIGWL